ncbi:Para-aminobenzoate synthase component 1 [Sarcina ventriculi]|uniref:Anthranilate synthase component 1 n=1 Tax=Sarcina ventriculi TaxID=1267 RepID=A0ABM9UKU6_SARVE|nr:aminodeoxychorismate synthase component I [Sarcina ventriculi]CUN43770.1 Para-aminobenzoate synthase component 1 [Sarcina ventriculi]SPZ50757.1 Para-aminobenzoate synthase component 1 [Sarcina ventriculi]
MNFKIKEIKTNVSSLNIYEVFSHKKETIFLDSSKEESKFSKYSFIGINPFIKFTAYKNDIAILDYKNKTKKFIKGDPFLELEKLILKYKVNYPSKIPLVSGALGYFSYDIGRVVENILDTAINDVKVPDAYFLFYDNIIIFDLEEKRTYVTSLGVLDSESESIEKIESLIKEKAKTEQKYFNVDIESKNIFYSNFEKSTYIDGVKKVKDYILSGDVYITNFTQRMWCYSNEDAFRIYSKLRQINKAPFSAFLNLDDFEIISSSPERFLNTVDKIVTTRPIKGTRPRGKDKVEDEKNKLELLNSEKDKAELLMVVDLERNDLSKVCEKNTVKVTELFTLESYATVFHLVSEVTGKLKENITSIKCMRECFPGGSITGTPKIRSMEVIEEIEGIRRNIYTGSIGYFDFRGNCDFNIIIRTILKKGNKAYFGVGGGITIESEEVAEYEESLDKAKALMRVL